MECQCQTASHLGDGQWLKNITPDDMYRETGVRHLPPVMTARMNPIRNTRNVVGGSMFRSAWGRNAIDEDTWRGKVLHHERHEDAEAKRTRVADVDRRDEITRTRHAKSFSSNLTIRISSSRAAPSNRLTGCFIAPHLDGEELGMLGPCIESLRIPVIGLGPTNVGMDGFCQWPWACSTFWVALTPLRSLPHHPASWRRWCLNQLSPTDWQGATLAARDGAFHVPALNGIF